MYQSSKVYCQILIDELNGRKAKNSKYSLRSFARDIGVHSSSLSAILNGKRNLPQKVAVQVCEKLHLEPQIEKRFLDSVHNEQLGFHTIKVGKAPLDLNIENMIPKLNQDELLEIPEEVKNLTRMKVKASREKIVGAKKIINEFYRKMYAYLADDDQGEETINVSVQLFPSETAQF